MKIRGWTGLGMIAIMLVWPPAADGQRRTGQAARRTPVVEVFQTARDAVVSIQATQIVEVRSPRSAFDGLFDELFDLPRRRGETRRFTTTSLGSGFVIHADGYVVTNAHVVAHCAAQKVIFADKSEYEAERVAIDERHDLAVLKINAGKTLPTIKLGRSDDLMVGETAIAIGNPLGYQHTVTTGIISAINRTLTVRKDLAYENLIQTDASINRGNSGGPLLNVLGELIGINTAIRSDAQNIGFAIPVDTLRKLLPEMLSIERSEKRLEIGLRLSWRNRVHVVSAQGPAARAGIEAGDELLSVNGVPIEQDYQFNIYLLRIDEDDLLKLELKRNGKRFFATLHPKPIPIPDGAKLLKDKFGLEAQLLTKPQARELKIRGGLVITAVERGSPADRAGFLRKHVVVQIDKHFPTNLEQVGLLLERVERNDVVVFGVYEIRRSSIEVLRGELIAR